MTDITCYVGIRSPHFGNEQIHNYFSTFQIFISTTISQPKLHDSHIIFRSKIPNFSGFFLQNIRFVSTVNCPKWEMFFVDSQPICTNWPNSQHIPSWEWAKSNSQLFPKLSTSVGTLSQETSQSMTDITCYDTDITVNGGYYILLIETSQRMEDITSHWWRYSIDWWTLPVIDGDIIVNGGHYMVLMETS